MLKEWREDMLRAEVKVSRRIDDRIDRIVFEKFTFSRKSRIRSTLYDSK